MSKVISTEEFKAKKEEEQLQQAKENAPMITGVHPERSKMLADQINHNRIQSSEVNRPSQSGLNELIQRFRRARKFKGFGLLTKVHRFDNDTCIVSCSVKDTAGNVIAKTHASWDKDLIWNAQFVNVDDDELVHYQATCNRDRLELTENIAICRALRMLGL